MARAPRLFTIPSGAPFLPTLARAILDRAILPDWPDPADPLSLAAGTILVPTRRAARLLGETLAAETGGPATLLPRIVPLGDAEEAEENAALATDGLGGPEDAALPPAIGEAQRRLELAGLIQAWARRLAQIGAGSPRLVDTTPGEALALAEDLGRIIDTLSIHGRRCEDIDEKIPGEFDESWRVTQAFLRIAAEYWPARAAELGAMDAALRRHRLLMAEAERLSGSPPDGPMIVAGSTGSMPATAALMGAIARLEKGAVVLPGLDKQLDARSWEQIPEGRDLFGTGHPGHPQAVLAGLLRQIGVDRDAVQVLGRAARPLQDREWLLSEALRPAETTDRWATNPLPAATIASALADVALVEAADEREEALAIAIALRETLSRPGATAALITPDRGIAQRVAAELARWTITVEDSAGVPLARTPVGVLARLVATVACDPSGEALLALLDHPLCRLGLDLPVLRRARATLEIGVLRGAFARPDPEGLRRGLALLADASQSMRRRWPGPKKALGDADIAAAGVVLDALDAALAGLRALATTRRLDLAAMAAAHARALDAVLAVPAEQDEALRPSDALALAALDEVIAATASPGPPLAGPAHDFPGVLDGLLRGPVVAVPSAQGGRLQILGLLEARLVHVDRAILAGLDETVWPPDARIDAFLNRPMRRALHLPAPERRIGQTAHDVVQAMGAPEAILTRAAKRGGEPTVASRIVQRIAAVSGPEAWAAVRARGGRWLGLSRQLDRPTPVPPARRPAPRPGGDRLPRRLSVTEIETLVRDPYAIYARHVLRLDPLDPIDQEPGAAVKGILIHDAVSRFAELFPDHLPPDALARLEALGAEAFATAPELAGRPELRAVWEPRFKRMARFLIDWERSRRDGRTILTEKGGSHAIVLPDGFVVTLTGRADRLEVVDGRLVVVDYKTGAVPSLKQVELGFSPQLTLEAAMALRGAFEGVPADIAAGELLYVKLSGGTPAGELTLIKPKDGRTVAALAEEHYRELLDLLADYRQNDRPYPSRPYAQFAKRYAPYDHLARVREWSLAGAEGDAP